jgi:hydroxymethylpyrimidine pyrophosphatase-like HAD family hydrolase
MKKNKISFETSFWAGYATGNPLKAINAFFDFADLDYYKQSLNEAVIYSYKTKVYKEHNPSDVFVLYTVVSSFLKVCYCLQEKSKKWKVKESLRSETVFHLSSLTKEEYDNPFIVFQKAFEEKTLEEFELFLCQILELSLSPRAGNPDSNVTTPYIHLIKMLDAVELIRERNVEKIKKTDRVAVTE